MTYSKVLGILGAVSIACTLTISPTVAQADEASEPETNYGIGLRARHMILLESMLELFMKDAPGGASNTGFGVELIREKGPMSFSIGFEYDPLLGTEGFYVDNDDAVDRVRFNDFEWWAVDINFMWQTGLIGDILSLRYGAGLGIGLMRGEIRQDDQICTSSTPSDATCMADPAGEQNQLADTPPVFPVVNAILGLQIRPIKTVAINIEGGLRTVPFFGVTTAVMF